MQMSVEVSQTWSNRLRRVLPGLLRVVVGEHADFRIARLQRRVDHVARDDRVAPRLADPDRVMIDRVPRRWDQLDQVIQLVVAGDRALPASPPRSAAPNW